MLEVYNQVFIFPDTLWILFTCIINRIFVKLNAINNSLLRTMNGLYADIPTNIVYLFINLNLYTLVYTSIFLRMIRFS